jgi:hypothetical protein
VKTNLASKKRADVNIGRANSGYSFWNISNTVESSILIEFIFVNNGRKLVIIRNRLFLHSPKHMLTLSNREFCPNFCRKVMTDPSRLLNNYLFYTNFIVKTNRKWIDLKLFTFFGIGTTAKGSS